MTVLAKRPHETHWQWRSRLMALAQQERDRTIPLITPELESRGWYTTETVMHVETGTRVETKRRRGLSSLVRMHQTGRLDNEQYAAAISIARVAERIERSVSVRCASLEARVDCSSGSRDVLFERLSQVRDEAAYTRWRRQIPLPRRMILDMILVDRPMSTTARMHGVQWEHAREMLIDALDLWCQLRARVAKEIDRDDISRAHARLAA